MSTWLAVQEKPECASQKMGTVSPLFQTWQTW
jgi:hypothetical protein